MGFSLAWYRQIFTDPEWRSALTGFAGLALSAAAIAVAIALPLSWFLWRRIAPWARIFQLLGLAPFILPPVITALGFLTLLGYSRCLWPAVDGRHQPRDLLRHAAAGDPVARLCLDRPVAGGGGGDHGCRRPHRTHHRRSAADRALSGLRLRLRLRAVAQRIHRRLYDDRLHHGDAADQDLQCAALRLYADHGRGDDLLRRRRGAGVRRSSPSFGDIRRLLGALSSEPG